MIIRTVSVSSQRKLPHPNVDFANYSSMVSLQADLAEGDDVEKCTAQLQQQADKCVDEHLGWIAFGMRAPAVSKAAQATAGKAAQLAAKHGAKV